MAVNLVNEGNSFIIDQEYDEALDRFNRAINLDGDYVDAYVQRSICYYLMKDYQASLKDAEVAVAKQGDHAKANQRLGLALFQLQEFGKSLSAFEKANSLAPSSSLQTWIRKCNAELDDSDSGSEADAVPATQDTPKPTVTEAPIVIPTATPTRKIRHDWIQTAEKVSVTVFVKNRTESQVNVDIKEQSIDVVIDLDGSEYNLDIDLCDKIVPEESTYKVFKTKVEITLKKAAIAQWPNLEQSEAEVVAWGSVHDTAPATRLSYQDWDKMAKEIDEETKEEKDLQGVFEDIYKGGSDDQRRAMMKSFVESSGTVLSTNWKEVGAGKVEGAPPKGMDMKNWGDRHH